MFISATQVEPEFVVVSTSALDAGVPAPTRQTEVDAQLTAVGVEASEA
jgi:hypothetical protein